MVKYTYLLTYFLRKANPLVECLINSLKDATPKQKELEKKKKTYKAANKLAQKDILPR